MSRFKPITREMNDLFPPSMNDWLPEQHLARFIEVRQAPVFSNSDMSLSDSCE